MSQYDPVRSTAPPVGPAGSEDQRRRPSPILERGIVVAAGPLLVFSIYLLFAGHNQPGGGFAGGLVAGVAVVLAWSGGGPATVQRVVPVRSSILMGAGLCLAATTGFVSMFAGYGYLESGAVTVDIPLIGKVKAVSPLAFDFGVYLTVVGMSLGLVRALGEESATADIDADADAGNDGPGEDGR